MIFHPVKDNPLEMNIFKVGTNLKIIFLQLLETLGTNY